VNSFKIGNASTPSADAKPRLCAHAGWGWPMSDVDEKRDESGTTWSRPARSCRPDNSSVIVVCSRITLGHLDKT